MAYLEHRPILVCTDEDVAIEARIVEGDDMDWAVTLTFREASSPREVKLELGLSRSEWRAWTNAVNALFRAEDRAAARRMAARKEEEE